VEAVGGLVLSADGSRLGWYGEDAMRPERVYTLDLTRKGARPTLVAEPAAAELADVQLGRHETWDFTSESGTRILGDVYYPPEYTPETSRSWPCIVFYYGGTSPVSREYGGRYPKNLWAAHGYVVYVLQPSGATGFGQEFSSRHVNDWGQTTADEIIEGTGKFLEAHPFVDRDRVGCIGASYGGFMTMMLATKTDLFAAAISHAGISALTSYWGEGWWGVDYSSVATSGSYPWNRPDLYVEQSPLFHADRITTPLLLLHGAADTNVPVGESEQMYAALRVLGKPVEFIRVDGQNHWILNYPQRVVWMETIIAWFDRQLKGQPAWWDELYGDDKAGGGR
jgi:dipeptidyl aminopeptidase/acylaminoacyl peptidase